MSNAKKKTAYPYITEFKKEPFKSFALIDERKIGSFYLSNYNKITDFHNSFSKSLQTDPNLNLEILYWFTLFAKYLKEDIKALDIIYNFILKCEVNIIEKDQLGFKITPESQKLPDIWSSYYALSSLKNIGLLERYLSSKGRNDIIRKIKNFIYQHKKNDTFLHCLDKECEIHKKATSAKSLYFIFEIFTLLGIEVRSFREQFRSFLNIKKKEPTVIYKLLCIRYLDLVLDVKEKDIQCFHQFQKLDGGFNFSNESGSIDVTFWTIYVFNNYSWLLDYNPARIYSFINQNFKELLESDQKSSYLNLIRISKLTILLSLIWKKFIAEIERVIFKQIEKEGYIDINQIKTTFGLTYGIEEIILYINLSYNFNLKVVDNTIEFINFTKNLSQGNKIILTEINTKIRENSVICLSEILKTYRISSNSESLKLKEDIFPLIKEMIDKNYFKGNIRAKTRFLRKPKFYFYLDYLLDKIIISDIPINSDKLYDEKVKLEDIKNDIYNMTLSLKNAAIQIKEEIESYLLLDEVKYAKERLKFIIRNALIEADFLNENIENSFNQDMKYINMQAILATEISQWKKAYTILQKKLNEVENYLKEKISEKEDLKKFNIVLDELENKVFEIAEYTEKKIDSFRKFFRDSLESGYTEEKFVLFKEEIKKISNNIEKYDQIIYRVSQQITIKEKRLLQKHKKIIENWVNSKEKFEEIFSYYIQGFKSFNETIEKIRSINNDIKNEIQIIKERTKSRISENKFKEAFEIIRKDADVLVNQKINELKTLKSNVKDQIKSRQKLFLLYRYLQEKLNESEENILVLIAGEVQALKDKVLEERNRTKIEDFDNFISEEIHKFKSKIKVHKDELDSSSSLKIKDIVNGFDRILIELDEKNKQFLKKLNNLKNIIKNFDQNSITIIQWKKFEEYLTNEIKNSKELYVNNVITNEIYLWAKEKSSNKINLTELANKLKLKCKALIPIINEMIEFSKLEGDLYEDKKIMIVHTEEYYKNKELSTFIENKLLKLHQEKIGKILALYESSIKNKTLTVNILELQNRINDYSELEENIRLQCDNKIKELEINEEREENVETRKHLEDIIQNGKFAIQNIMKNLKIFNRLQLLIAEQYNNLKFEFLAIFSKLFENIEKFESHMKVVELFKIKKQDFDIKLKSVQQKISEELNGSLEIMADFRNLETEIREFIVSNKKNFLLFYKSKLDKIIDDINVMKDEFFRNELLESFNKNKVRLSQLLGTLQTKVEDFIEYKEFKRAHIKVEKRQKKIEYEIREVTRNAKILIREYERKSRNFETKNRYLIDDFEQFIKNFREILTEKVKSLDELIVSSYVSMAVKAVANQYLTIGFLQNELKIKKQKIQEHLISLISSGKLEGKYDPRIGLYYENPEILDKLDKTELEVMKKMNFRFYMFYRRLKSFASQNYSIFAFLAAILSITISLSTITGPTIFFMLILIILAIVLYFYMKRRKQEKI